MAKRSWRSIHLDERFVPGEKREKKGTITKARRGGWREGGRVQNEKRMRNCHPGRGSVSAANGFMGGFPGSSLLLWIFMEWLTSPTGRKRDRSSPANGKHECG
ncbi:hypothetical protein CDAR_398891 [Caerostris darwini]|uniref:Uncharacterized protein n=1 Tax=Caerostris darwini TaxID=1538125 RepID=A0AAV4V9C8_9ARAC|nr:hypothetical protein CDAR_398891 [Caerostris darwini]